MAEQERRMTIGRRRFAKAEQRRNMILDFLRAKDGASPPEISDMLGETAQRTGQYLVRMVSKGEIRFVENAGVRRDGRPCRMYYAVAERTISADELLRGFVDNFNGSQPKPRPIPAVPKTVFGGLLV